MSQNPDAYVWRCGAGHEFAVSVVVMRSAFVAPRCQCGARLYERLRPFGEVDAPGETA